MSLSGSTISAVGQGKQVLVWVVERSLRWGVRGVFCDYIPGPARILRDSLIQTDGSCLFVADQDGPVPVCNGRGYGECFQLYAGPTESSLCCYQRASAAISGSD